MGNDREMTVVERQVAAMMRKQREEQDEQAALARRAEALRSSGEKALQDSGDFDQDSDSDGDEPRGATGRARRNFRDRGIVFDSSGDHEITVTVRAMTDLELGMAFAWMRRDQRRYEGATSFWSKASVGIQECFEETRCPGDKDVHAAVGAWPRLTGAFVPFLGPAPFAFAMLKDDGLTVDTMGVRQGFRRMGLGRAVARAFIDRARRAAEVRAGPPECVIDAVPNAVAFWRAMGFVNHGRPDSPTTAVMRKIAGDVAMALTLLEDPPTPRGHEWWFEKPKEEKKGYWSDDSW
jgi:GNAT superfamily N-acetyltransferase